MEKSSTDSVIYYNDNKVVVNKMRVSQNKLDLNSEKNDKIMNNTE